MICLGWTLVGMVILAIVCLFYLLADGTRTEIGVLFIIALMLFLIAAGFAIARDTIFLMQT